MSFRERLDNVIGDLNDPDGEVQVWIADGGAKSKMKGDGLREIVSRLAAELEGVRDEMPDSEQVSSQEYAGTTSPEGGQGVESETGNVVNPSAREDLVPGSYPSGVEDPSIPTPAGSYVAPPQGDPNVSPAVANDPVSPINDPSENPQVYGPEESENDDADVDNVDGAEESDEPSGTDMPGTEK